MHQNSVRERDIPQESFDHRVDNCASFGMTVATVVLGMNVTGGALFARPTWLGFRLQGRSRAVLALRREWSPATFSTGPCFAASRWRNAFAERLVPAQDSGRGRPL
jgi:hypothetical protein